jgi:hypothetical protein
MQRLTPDQRAVLQEIGEPGEPCSHEAFTWALAHGYGYWAPDETGEEVWWVTESGRRVRAYDDAADDAIL